MTGKGEPWHTKEEEPQVVCTSFGLYLMWFVPHVVCTSLCIIRFVPQVVCTSFCLYLMWFVPQVVSTSICTSCGLYLTSVMPHFHL